MRDPSLERKKPGPPLKVVLLLPKDLPSTTLGILWVLTNWRRCQGRKCKSALGGDKDFKKKGFLWANRDFYSWKCCIIFLGDSTSISSKILECILAPKRLHTWGNPNIETLLSVENTERLLRNKGKEQIDISQFGASSSQEFHSIQDFGRETNFGKSLLK